VAIDTHDPRTPDSPIEALGDRVNTPLNVPHEPSAHYQANMKGTAMDIHQDDVEEADC
jgi:hypothetical protein